MQEYFYTLADFIGKQLQGNEVYLAEFTAEQSDFIRFNKAKIRQPGNVEQRYLLLDLIDGQRHINEQFTLSGELKIDYERIATSIRQLRNQLPHIPADPYLLYATEINSTESIGNNNLLAAPDAVNEILTATGDLVGIYAAGSIFTGFANSFGQRNWHSSYTFNFDWSLYHSKDKAVKSAYAGFEWNSADFTEKVSKSLNQLEILKQEPHIIQPGKYKVYLAPAAMFEIFQLLAWNSFGLKSHKTKDTALLRMLEGQNLHSSINMMENIKDGIAPTFQAQGFIKPEQVSLINQGIYDTALISPRSAKEYDVNTNGANDEEYPTSLDLAAGNFANDEILKELDTGI
ncbi:MAG: TldE/PmbA family protein, partial [Proteobacteria bacterium]|nr:TldE/PmbA family protein [Pseudomonadota bacterium]